MKIKYDKVEKQILEQYENSLHDLPRYMTDDDWKLWSDNICTVLISTGEKDLEDQFDNFKKSGNKNAVHLIWKGEDKNDESIKAIILNLLNQNATGKIAPIPTYTADTLRALVNFIENDFSSDADDQQKGGERQEVKRYTNLEEAITNGGGKLSNMPEQMKEWIRRLDKVIDKDGLGIDYTKNLIVGKFNGRKIWDIGKQKGGVFKVRHFYTPNSYGEDHGENAPRKGNEARYYYERNDLKITDTNSERLVLDILKFTKNHNQNKLKG